MKKNITIVLCAIVAAALVGVFLFLGHSDGKMKVGAAGVGGSYYAFANAYTQLVSQDNEDYNFEVTATAGTTANLRLLSEGYMDMALAQADLIDDAYYGNGDFSEKAYKGYSAIAGLYTEACQIIVQADSGIEEIADLQGKTISIGEDESGTQINALQVLQLSGLNDNLYTAVNLDYVEAANELKDGKIDAFFCTSGVQTSVIEELAKDCDIKLIEPDEKCISKLLKAYDFYSEYTIPAETYTGQTEDVHTIGVEAVLLVKTKMKASTVKELTAGLFEHQEDIEYSTSTQNLLSPEDAVKGISIPFHDGAKAYYEENGIDVE